MKSIKSFLSVFFILAVLHGSVQSVQARQIERSAFRPSSHPDITVTKCQQHFRSLKSQASEHALSLRGGVSNTVTNALLGAVVMALIEKGVKELFKTTGVKFPSQLAGCLILFASLLVGEMISPSLARSIFDALSPGAALLAKWLPVFFVPALVMLPLAPSIGNSWEIGKVMVVCVVGFLYTIYSTVFSVMAVMKLQGKDPTAVSVNAAIKKTSGPAPKPFSDVTMDISWKGSVIFGILSVLALRSGYVHARVVNTIFYSFLSIALYVWGARLPTGIVKYLHPLVTSSVLVLLTMKSLASLVGMSFIDYLRLYRVGSIDPLKAGAGDIFLYLLGPAVVSFAISMYGRRALIKSNLLTVLTAMFVSSVGGLYGTAIFVRLISLGGENGAIARLSMLSRNVTTALAMALTAVVGGDISIAAAVVSVTGIIGATYGKSLLNYMGIQNPVVRGLGIGSSSQGLGVASIADEADAFPFAAISMIMTAICGTTLVSIPAVKDSLVKLATGA